ncbi:glycosyltransferase family 39 protein [uncultured Draconibacterium sp.]|uniref:ArnT family glycosyltransferase n=1 Tax=uncultured Draconibacterium sp. TaxID=1573823 RepID=UPI0032163746
MNQFIDKIKNYFLLLPLFIFVAIAFPHLSLPYFWDEAWSYFPAAFKMYENGPSLIPGSLPLWDAKGHPLFFFFISSVWMQLFGTSVFAVHLLPFLISLSTLGALFVLVKKQAGTWAANIAILLFSVQSLFLAQATFLLPEMLITLLLLLAIHFYLDKKYWLFVLVASIMVMTKETSIVFIGGFLLFHLFVYLKPDKESRRYIFESVLLCLPLIVYGMFLILHKKAFGTFLFQEHTGYIEFSFAAVARKLQIATGIIFTRYGRNIILLATLIAPVILIIKKIKLQNKKLLALLLVLTILFLLFSALNFYTQRYMLSLLALFITLTSVLLVQVKFSNRYLNVLIVAIISAVPFYYSLTKKSNSDSDLGFVNVVKVHQQMVKYCEEQGWQEQPISASFNLIFCLRNPHLGYVSSEKGFSNVMDLKKFNQAEIYLNDCTSFGADAQLDSIVSSNKLVKEFELQKAWGKIYTQLPVKE